MNVEDIRKDIEKRKNKKIEILDIKVKKNYGIVFMKQDDLEEDLSGLYEGLARILYKHAL